MYSAGGFRGSIDWYHIDLTDTIGVLAPQDVVDRCFEGNTALCDLITFNPDQTIASIAGRNLNLGTFDLKGIDAELRYSLALGSGELSSRLDVAAISFTRKSRRPAAAGRYRRRARRRLGLTARRISKPH